MYLLSFLISVNFTDESHSVSVLIKQIPNISCSTSLISFSYETEEMKKLLQAAAVRAEITSCSFVYVFNALQLFILHFL